MPDEYKVRAKQVSNPEDQPKYYYQTYEHGFGMAGGKSLSTDKKPDEAQLEAPPEDSKQAK